MSDGGHLDVGTLRRLARWELGEAARPGVARHLQVCHRCRGRLRRLSADGEAVLLRLFENRTAGSEDGLGAAFRNVREVVGAAVAEARGDGTAGWRRADGLLALDSGARRRAVAEDAALVSWPVVERLLEECARRWKEDAVEAGELAALGLELARRLERRKGGGGEGEAGGGGGGGGGPRPELRADLVARCWAYLGNSRRVAADLHGASDAFVQAHRALESGSGDPQERARVLDLEASLLRERCHFPGAEAALTEAAELYRRVADREGEARVRVKQALAVAHAGRVEEAVEIGVGCLHLIAPQQAPRLYMAACFNLANDLLELGRLDSAGDVLRLLRPLLRDHAGELDRLRRDWLEGRMSRDRGQAERAEALLTATRDAYLERGAGLTAATVALDLAVLWLEQGRMAETRALVRDLVPLFAAQDVRREALAAFLLFRRASMADTLTAALAREVAGTVGRHAQPSSARGDDPA